MSWNYHLGRVIHYDQRGDHNTIDVDGVRYADAVAASPGPLRPYDFVLLLHQNDQWIILAKIREQ